jgi:hypothetical protein
MRQRPGLGVTRRNLRQPRAHLGDQKPFRWHSCFQRSHQSIPRQEKNSTCSAMPPLAESRAHELTWRLGDTACGDQPISTAHMCAWAHTHTTCTHICIHTWTHTHTHTPAATQSRVGQAWRVYLQANPPRSQQHDHLVWGWSSDIHTPPADSVWELGGLSGPHMLQLQGWALVDSDVQTTQSQDPHPLHSDGLHKWWLRMSHSRHFPGLHGRFRGSQQGSVLHTQHACACFTCCPQPSSGRVRTSHRN